MRRLNYWDPYVWANGCLWLQVRILVTFYQVKMWPNLHWKDRSLYSLNNLLYIFTHIIRCEQNKFSLQIMLSREESMLFLCESSFST